MPTSPLAAFLNRRESVLAEGSVYELLRRSPRVEFDPYIAHAGLIFDASASKELAGIHRAYCDIASAYGLPILTFTDTWRANPERVASSAFSQQPVNRANAEFLCRMREDYRKRAVPIWVAGLIGCRGNAYRPEETLTIHEAQDFHARQIRELGDTGIDLLFAATLPAVEEACGMAMLMAETELPYILSFVIRRDGTVLDGTAIDQAVERIDGLASRAPLGYFLNCVHPDVVLQATSAPHASTLTSRFIGLQANTSSLDPAELDGMEDLQIASPQPFATQVLQVGHRCNMSIFGGCCGTTPEHIRCIAEGLAASRQL